MKDNENKEVIVPCNIEAEQNLLGIILSNNEYINKVGDILNPDHFYVPIHSKIYDAIIKLFDKGMNSDPITIKNYFAKEKVFLGDISSYDYLLKLVSEIQFSSDITTLAKIIYDSYVRRRIITVGQDYILKAKEEKIDERGENLLESMEHELYEIATNTHYKTGYDTLTSSIRNTLERIEKATKSGKDISGIDTSYYELNSMTGGLQNSDLIIIAGRPSMGKTALAVNIALRAAKTFSDNKDNDEKKKSVLFFSLEMSSEQVASRILSIETKIDGSKIRVGKVNKTEFKELSRQIVNLQDVPIMIDDTPSLTISAIRTRARRMKRQHNLGLVVIDYLQLINTVGRAQENRVQEIAEISKGLKAIAKELDIPVIAASQLSRAVESREDKRPLLSDLRESGNIEQDADIVMFIYREEYYLSRKIPTEDKKLLEWQDKMDKVANIADIIVAKQRNGPVGNFSLRYDNKTTAFDNLS